jgi:hypothetical protein
MKKSLGILLSTLLSQKEGEAMSFLNAAQLFADLMVPFTVVRQPDGDWNADGVYVNSQPVNLPMSGSIQPVKAEMMQTEGGRYTMDDKVIYTPDTLQIGDVIAYQGRQYTVDNEGDWSEYTDLNKYFAKRVSSHDPV